MPTESQNDDMVMNQYIIKSEPSQKRFKEDYAIDEQSADEEENAAPPKAPTTPKRNPFKRSVSCKDELLSPTRISKENNSLVKTQSPVKKIDYGKLEKLSRFSRTVVSNKQHVISRFFDSATKTTGASEEKSVEKSDSGLQMKSPNLLEFQTESPKSALYFNRSSDSGFSPNTQDSSKPKSQDESSENSVDDELSQENQCSILSKFKCVLKEKMDPSDQEPMESEANSQAMSDKIESETLELPIVLSDDENVTNGSQNSAGKGSSSQTWLSASQKSKTVRKNERKFDCIFLI